MLLFRLAPDWEQYDQTADYLTKCPHLLLKTVLRTNSHDDLQYMLRTVLGLGSLAVSVFLGARKSALESLDG